MEDSAMRDALIAIRVLVQPAMIWHKNGRVHDILRQIDEIAVSAIPAETRGPFYDEDELAAIRRHLSEGIRKAREAADKRLTGRT